MLLMRQDVSLRPRLRVWPVSCGVCAGMHRDLIVFAWIVPVNCHRASVPNDWTAVQTQPQCSLSITSRQPQSVSARRSPTTPRSDRPRRWTNQKPNTPTHTPLTDDRWRDGWRGGGASLVGLRCAHSTQHSDAMRCDAHGPSLDRCACSHAARSIVLYGNRNRNTNDQRSPPLRATHVDQRRKDAAHVRGVQHRQRSGRHLQSMQTRMVLQRAVPARPLEGAQSSVPTADQRGSCHGRARCCVVFVFIVLIG